MLSVAEQYKYFSPFLQIVCENGVQDLTALMARKGIRLAMPIEVRAKRWESVEQKIGSGKMTVRHIFDVQDLVGLRVVVLYRRQIETVVSVFRELFVLKRVYSPQSRMQPDQFGYSSDHVVLKVPQTWLPDETTPLMRDKLLCEVQVRTLAQHLWASVSHDLQYKNVDDAPSELRRSLGRTSALLEQVDSVVDEVLNARAEYLNALSSSTEVDEPINVDSLAATLDRTWPKENLLDDEPYAMLLKDLRRQGIVSRDTFAQILEKHRYPVLMRSAREAERIRSAAEIAGVVDGAITIKRDNATAIMHVNAGLLEKVSKGIFYGHCALTWLALQFESGEVSAGDSISIFRERGE